MSGPGWYDPDRDRAKARERMRRLRADPAYREKELVQQRVKRNTEEGRAYQRDRYNNLTGQQYAYLLLKRRRTKALARMAKRHLPKEEGA